MKIGHFPDFLPDETVFSVAGRYLDRMQFRSYSTVSQHFFGGRTKGGVRDLPSNLEHLIQTLPSYHIYTSDIIIDRHTHFPLYAPFLPTERALALRENMKANSRSRYGLIGIKGSRVLLPQWIRYCPECIDYDRSRYGECYWHRLHQVPGVLVCPIHEVMLEDSSVNAMLGNTFALFRSAERSVSNLSRRNVPVHFRAPLIQLANNAKWLLEQPFSLEQGNIQQRYMSFLANRGFVTISGKLRYEQIKEAMLDYYPPHLLKDLECDILRTGNWLKKWRLMYHPLHHLLLIQFLCENTQEFFTQPQYSSHPFRNGPWPCLNPLCSSYKEHVIPSYRTKRTNSNKPIAEFACLICGFAYSRSGPDTDDNAQFRIGSISQFGSIWDNQLTTYWLNQNISISQIARLMRADRQTIRRQAARLGLPFAPNIPRRGKRPKIYQDFIEEQRDLYRTLWEEEIRNHSNMKISEAVRKKGYHWLSKYDPEWLKDHFPTGDTSSKGKRLMLANVQLRYESYSLVDADWAKIVRSSAEELLSRTDFPIQLTRKLLVAQLSRSVLLKRPDLLIGRTEVVFRILPLTSRALDEAVETIKAFIWRKLRWAVQSCLVQQTQPFYKEFLSLARIGSSTSNRPIIKELIQIAFNKLRAYIPLSYQMPEMRVEERESASRNKENVQSMTWGSLAATCIGKQLMLPDAIVRPMRQEYDLVPILLLTTAAVVNGAQNHNAIAKWGYQNPELLRWFGLPEDKFPEHSTLRKIYAKIDIDSFESVLGTWLHETFPLQQNEAVEVKAHTGSTYVPGLRLLRSYRHIASEVVAKLR